MISYDQNLSQTITTEDKRFNNIFEICITKEITFRLRPKTSPLTVVTLSMIHDFSPFNKFQWKPLSLRCNKKQSGITLPQINYISPQNY